MNVVIPKGVLDLFLKNMFLNLQKLEVSIFHHDWLLHVNLKKIDFILQ